MKPVTTVLSLKLDNRHQILLLFNSCCIIEIVVSTLAKMLSICQISISIGRWRVHIIHIRGRRGIHYIEECKEDRLRKVYVPWGALACILPTVDPACQSLSHNRVRLSIDGE